MTELAVMPQYEAYKDSGVEWLGKIPVHWEVKPLKHSAKLISEKTSSKDSPLRYLGMENIQSGTGKILNGESEVEGLANKFEKNDILFGKLRPYLAKVAIAESAGICSTEMLVYRTPNSEQAVFYKYLLLSSSFIHLVDSSTYGSKMPRASSEFIGVQRIPTPPDEEKTAIAAYLDTKTTQIDQAVAIKEQQIELLKERRQILIQNAVTRGLDPQAPMRDSGVEWIGEIPAHWQMHRVKNLFRLIVEPAEKNSDHELLSIYTDIGVKPRKELAEKGNKASTTDGYWLVKKGDFIVNKLLAWMGAIGLSEYKGVTSPAYDILRPSRPLQGMFYHYLFRTQACSSELKRHSRGTMEMRLRLYFDKFGAVMVPYPSEKEQKQIVEHIGCESAKINKAITLQQQQIDKLKEYRATLINSAVTGKIKVPMPADSRAA